MAWKAIITIKNGRTYGLEGMHVELLKNGTEKLICLLVELFGRYINRGVSPTKLVCITPIHKKGTGANYICNLVAVTMIRIYGKIWRNIIQQEYGSYKNCILSHISERTIFLAFPNNKEKSEKSKKV